MKKSEIMCHDLCVFCGNLGALRQMHFTLIAATDFSLLLSGSRGRAHLICEDKISRFDAKNSELNISVGGCAPRYISDDKIDDMGQNAVNDLDQWAPKFVQYRLDVGFCVIELNDIDSTDIGPQTLPPLDELSENLGLFVISRDDPNDNIRSTLHVNVNGGIYDVLGTVTTYDDFVLKRTMRALVVNSASTDG